MNRSRELSDWRAELAEHRRQVEAARAARLAAVALLDPAEGLVHRPSSDPSDSLGPAAVRQAAQSTRRRDEADGHDN